MEIPLAVTCPECGSRKVYRAGFRYSSSGEQIQRFLCCSCGFRFSNNVHKECPTLHQCRICVPKEGMKNLTQQQKHEPVAGETKPLSDTKGKIAEFLWQLKKDGYKEATIRTHAKFLNALLKDGADLYNGETVKEAIARHTAWQPSTKHLVSTYYEKFALANNIPYKPPEYEATEKLPFIPLESEIDSLISSCGNKISTMLQLLKETGMLIGEALRLKWINLDPQQRTITLNDPEKHGKPRMFKASELLFTRLNRLPKKSQRIFGNTDDKERVEEDIHRTQSSFETNFSLQRKRIAQKLQNSRLLQIHFHTLRHWKATMEYHKTKDILYVMQLLGHRGIQNTLKYTQLVNFESNDYHSATAKNIEEASKLVEAGFEYVLTNNDVMLFRKRK